MSLLIYTAHTHTQHKQIHVMFIGQTSKSDQKIKTWAINAWINYVTKSQHDLHSATNNWMEQNGATYWNGTVTC